MAVVISRALPGARGRGLGRLSHYAREMLEQAHLRFRLANVVCGLLPDFGSGAIRTRAYRWVGFAIGPGTFIGGNLELAGGGQGAYQKLHIGHSVNIANHITINLDDEVRLGNGVSLSPFVKIYTATHPIGPGSNRRLGDVVTKPVTIEDGCWIGLGAMILPGVTVGHGSIVAAGAVVDQDVPPDSHVIGNPAQVVRQLPWGDR